MQKSDTPYLQHILDAIEQLEEYTDGVTYEEYCYLSLLQDGLIRQLAIIGEASNHLSDNFKNTCVQIPWVDIITMRNKLVHEYFGIDIKTVWLVVQEDLPPLKEVVSKALAKSV